MSLTAGNSTLFSPDALSTPESLRPDRIRVVDLENESEGCMLRLDCYELETEDSMFRIDGDEMEACAVNWADSPLDEDEVRVCWMGTGLSAERVDRIRIFSWPHVELMRVYRNVASS